VYLLLLHTDYPKCLSEQLKGGKIYFGSQYQKFSSTDLGSVDSGPMVRQNIMGTGACGGEGGLSPGRQEAERGSFWGSCVTFKGIPTPTYFL
jgi:hypothetical protein